MVCAAKFGLFVDEGCLMTTKAKTFIGGPEPFACLYTFTAKRDCSRIYRSLPIATTVEI